MSFDITHSQIGMENDVIEVLLGILCDLNEFNNNIFNN